VGLVELLLVERHLTGDPVALDADAAAHAVLVQVRADVLVARVPAQVPVELAVGGIAGVALVGAPHLAPGFQIAREHGRPARRAHRRVDPALRVRAAPVDAVRVDEEVVDALLAEERVDAVVVAALGQPDAARAAAEGARVGLYTGADLRAPRRRPAHQR